MLDYLRMILLSGFFNRLSRSDGRGWSGLGWAKLGAGRAGDLYGSGRGDAGGSSDKS